MDWVGMPKGTILAGKATSSSSLKIYNSRRNLVLQTRLHSDRKIKKKRKVRVRMERNQQRRAGL